MELKSLTTSGIQAVYTKLKDESARKEKIQNL
jgi:hypothetical protein